MHRPPATAVAASLVLVLAILLGPATAGAASRRAPAPMPPSANAVIRDCSKSPFGALRRAYSARVLKRTLRKIDGDLAEYTNCFDAIRHAQRRTRATIVVGIRRSPRGRLARGSVAVLDGRGRTLDALAARAGGRVAFTLRRGRYTVRVDGRRACGAKVRAQADRVTRVTVMCTASRLGAAGGALGAARR